MLEDKYVNFRADSVMDEWFRPRTLVIGDYLYVVRSAFAGCYVCRIIMIHIIQSLTRMSQLVTTYETIKKIGLRLDLDDRLSLHCWHGEGRPVRLSDLSVAGVVELRDNQPKASHDTVKEAGEGRLVLGGLYWERDVDTGFRRLSDSGQFSNGPSNCATQLINRRWKLIDLEPIHRYTSAASSPLACKLY